MENFISFFMSNHFGIDLVLLCIFSSELKDYIQRLKEGNKDFKISKESYMMTQIVNFILLTLFVVFILIDYLQPQYDVARYYYFIFAIFFGLAWLWPIDKD